MNSLKLKMVAISMLTSVMAFAQWGKEKKIKGNGDITTITRNTSDYDGVKASGSLDYILVPGTEGSITIKGDSNLTQHILTEIKDGNLIIKTEKGYYLKPTQNIIITVPYESIDLVSLFGSGDVISKGTIKSENFKVSLAGSGDIKLNVEANTIISSIAGSGDMQIQGNTTNLEVSIAGSGDYEGFGLKATNVRASISGSGEANLSCNGGNLKGRISGSGDITYKGKPSNVDNKVSGSGRIRGAND